ncbi:hypothetical protein EDD80_1256 [Anseongella ginsenosidimutans]|uniref:Uncharacterized protein n=1 Tax=Anseongella ginsenosidimutans TaxID=496056 RepID=A0A4R3KJJ9_9SPHI|nr:hypothetical protein [Anseongella ginsenosidimutans]QEC53627.1 hypothetical protein FRZ59_15640 [Anseongella ginsenosidimutans]TCS83915.1 hypothetical protein EDD80_1256 [Anseongella ginsenosidimutans]
MKTILLLIFLIFARSSTACTIFFLTDDNHALFYNNEDYTNPNTKMWFIPAGNNHYGCAFVGFDDGSAQGGINTYGLAFDWYAGKPDRYLPDAGMARVKGNSSERLLETCKTVEEAIAFYKAHAEPGFPKATILIADKTGASVIIGSRNGKLYFDKSTESRALGFGDEIFGRMYKGKASAEHSLGAEILKACVATGRGGTKYSNAYDLRTGDITVFDFSPHAESTTLNLLEELKKGAHYYDIPQINKQISGPFKPLLLNMHRLILHEFPVLPDQAPEISSKVRKFMTDASDGTMKPADYSGNLWEELAPLQAELQAEFGSLGDIKSIHLILKEPENKLTRYSYIIIFKGARALMQFTFENRTQRIHKVETLSGEAR